MSASSTNPNFGAAAAPDAQAAPPAKRLRFSPEVYEEFEALRHVYFDSDARSRKEWPHHRIIIWAIWQALLKHRHQFIDPSTLETRGEVSLHAEDLCQVLKKLPAPKIKKPNHTKEQWRIIEENDANYHRDELPECLDESECQVPELEPPVDPANQSSNTPPPLGLRPQLLALPTETLTYLAMAMHFAMVHKCGLRLRQERVQVRIHGVKTELRSVHRDVLLPRLGQLVAIRCQVVSLDGDETHTHDRLQYRCSCTRQVEDPDMAVHTSLDDRMGIEERRKVHCTHSADCRLQGAEQDACDSSSSHQSSGTMPIRPDIHSAYSRVSRRRLITVRQLLPHSSPFIRELPKHQQQCCVQVHLTGSMIDQVALGDCVTLCGIVTSTPTLCEFTRRNSNCLAWNQTVAAAATSSNASGAAPLSSLRLFLVAVSVQNMRLLPWQGDHRAALHMAPELTVEPQLLQQRQDLVAIQAQQQHHQHSIDQASPHLMTIDSHLAMQSISSHRLSSFGVGAHRISAAPPTPNSESGHQSAYDSLATGVSASAQAFGPVPALRLNISDEDRRYWMARGRLRIASVKDFQPHTVRTLVNSFAPGVVGMELHKLAALCQLVGCNTTSARLRPELHDHELKRQLAMQGIVSTCVRQNTDYTPTFMSPQMNLLLLSRPESTADMQAIIAAQRDLDPRAETFDTTNKPWDLVAQFNHNSTDPNRVPSNQNDSSKFGPSRRPFGSRFAKQQQNEEPIVQQAPLPPFCQRFDRPSQRSIKAGPLLLAQNSICHLSTINNTSAPLNAILHAAMTTHTPQVTLNGVQRVANTRAVSITSQATIEQAALDPSTHLAAQLRKVSPAILSEIDLVLPCVERANKLKDMIVSHSLTAGIQLAIERLNQVEGEFQANQSSRCGITHNNSNQTPLHAACAAGASDRYSRDQVGFASGSGSGSGSGFPSAASELGTMTSTMHNQPQSRAAAAPLPPLPAHLRTPAQNRQRANLVPVDHLTTPIGSSNAAAASSASVDHSSPMTDTTATSRPTGGPLAGQGLPCRPRSVNSTLTSNSFSSKGLVNSLPSTPLVHQRQQQTRRERQLMLSRSEATASEPSMTDEDNQTNAGAESISEATQAAAPDISQLHAPRPDRKLTCLQDYLHLDTEERLTFQVIDKHTLIVYINQLSRNYLPQWTEQSREMASQAFQELQRTMPMCGITGEPLSEHHYRILCNWTEAMAKLSASQEIRRQDIWDARELVQASYGRMNQVPLSEPEVRVDGLAAQNKRRSGVSGQQADEETEVRKWLRAILQRDTRQANRGVYKDDQLRKILSECCDPRPVGSKLPLRDIFERLQNADDQCLLLKSLRGEKAWQIRSNA